MVTLPFLSEDYFCFILYIVVSLKGNSNVVIHFYGNESVRAALLEHSEAYLKPCQTSEMETFSKKLHFRCFTVFRMCLLWTIGKQLVTNKNS